MMRNGNRIGKYVRCWCLLLGLTIPLVPFLQAEEVADVKAPESGPEPRPQKVHLSSGEILIGQVIDDPNTDELIVQSELFGLLQIPRRSVELVEAVPMPEIEIAEVEVAEGASEAELPDHEQGYLDRYEGGNPIVNTLAKADAILDSVRTIQSPDTWSGQFRLGVNLSQGDSKWTESFLSARLEISPEDSPNFFRLNGAYVYRETETASGVTVKSTDKYDATFTYRRYLHPNWFAQNSLGWRVDQIAGIDRELQALVGAGFHIKIDEKFEFLLGAGGGLEELDTVNDTNQAGYNNVLNTFQEMEWELTDEIDLTQSFTYFMNPDENEDYNYTLKAGIRYRFSDLLGLEFSYSRDYENDTGSGESQVDEQVRNSIVVIF